MRVVASISTEGLVPKLDLARARVKQITMMAGSSALRAMKAEAGRQIREKKAIKLKYVSRGLSMAFPQKGDDAPTWTLKASGAAMPVIAFPTRQTKRGVSAEINKGRRVLIRSAFIAQMKSGHVGVFYRQGKKRLPVDEAFTSRISEVFEDAVPSIVARGREVFVSTFDRLSSSTG